MEQHCVFFEVGNADLDVIIGYYDNYRRLQFLVNANILMKRTPYSITI